MQEPEYAGFAFLYQALKSYTYQLPANGSQVWLSTVVSVRLKPDGAKLHSLRRHENVAAPDTLVWIALSLPKQQVHQVT